PLTRVTCIGVALSLGSEGRSGTPILAQRGTDSKLLTVTFVWTGHGFPHRGNVCDFSPPRLLNSDHSRPILPSPPQFPPWPSLDATLSPAWPPSPRPCRSRAGLASARRTRSRGRSPTIKPDAGAATGTL